MNENTVIIGVGYPGCKILSKLNFDIQKIFIDTDKEVEEKYAGLRIGEQTCGKYSSGGNTNLGEMSALENKKEILEKIVKYKNWVIIAPMGGGTTCGVTKKIVEFAEDLQKTALVFTSLPLEFEGNRRQHIASNTMLYIENLCNVVKLSIDEKDIKAVKTVNEFFDKLDEVYLEELAKVLSE